MPIGVSLCHTPCREQDGEQVAAGQQPGRSPQWPKVRLAHLKLHPVCEVCGGEDDLSVHHIKAFHLNPECELDVDNLITLCESKERGVNCHLLFGHLGNFRRINPNVVKDSAVWKKKLTTPTP